MNVSSVSPATNRNTPITDAATADTADSANANDTVQPPEPVTTESRLSQSLIASDAARRFELTGDMISESSTEDGAQGVDTTSGHSFISKDILDDVVDVFRPAIDSIRDAIEALVNPDITTGLDPAVDAILNDSPLISRDIARLQREGYTIELGEPGAGSFINRSEQRIVIDPNRSVEQQARILAHEIGHAVNDPNFIGVDGVSREEYVEANTRESLRDEAAANLYQLEVRAELLEAGGPDLGVSGAQAAEYIRIFESGILDQPGGREQVIEQFADLFATGERPSTDSTVNYQEFYERAWGNIYDANT